MSNDFLRYWHWKLHHWFVFLPILQTRITKLANELLKVLDRYKGENEWDAGCIVFHWQVIGDEGVENYNVTLRYNSEQINFPIVKVLSDFYEEGDDW